MTTLVFLEGSIGAGKSTVLTEISTLGYVVVHEPVAMWSEHLRRVYHDVNWSRAMHVLALTTHVETILQALRTAREQHCTVVVERSFDSVDVFVQADKTMSDNDEYRVIHEMYRTLLEKELVGVPTKTIYMRTDPDKCFERIATRARPGEDGIDKAYLMDLHIVHETKFLERSTCIDANIDLDSVVKSVVANL
jgi:deoxyadenosine/deoxycytidine kinase